MPFGQAPQRQANTVTDKPKYDQFDGSSGARPRILLAEDSSAARVLTGALLQRIGAEVDTAENGEDALIFMQNYEYDLVIMDIEMPIMDGMTAAQSIRQLGGKAARTPIIALSAFLADTNKSSHWEEYFDHALAKPANKDKLYQAISRVLGPDALGSTTTDKKNPQVEVDTDGLINMEQQQVARGNLSDAEWVQLLQTATYDVAEVSQALSNTNALTGIDDIAAIARKLSTIAGLYGAEKLHRMAMALSSDASARQLAEIDAQIDATVNCATATSAVLRRLSKPTGGSAA